MEGFTEKIEEIKKAISDHINDSVSYTFCPFISDANYFRKPNPGMAYSIALQLELSLKHSVMVGDTDHVDGGFAKNAGIGRYYNINDFIAMMDRI